MDPPDIKNEVLAGTKLSNAAALAGLRDVECATVESDSFCNVSGSFYLTSGLSLSSNCALSRIDWRAAPIE